MKGLPITILYSVVWLSWVSINILNGYPNKFNIFLFAFSPLVMLILESYYHDRTRKYFEELYDLVTKHLGTKK